jgi:hypothetical protein
MFSVLTASDCVHGEPYVVEALLDKHRQKNGFAVGSSEFSLSYPDVLEVTSNSVSILNAFNDFVAMWFQFVFTQTKSTVTGKTLHFAPAVACNLLETEAFRKLQCNGEALRHVAQQCPHPQAAKLAQSKAQCLGTLFVLVRVFHSPTVVAADASPQSQLLMLPLSAQCILALLKNHFWADYNIGDANEPVSINLDAIPAQLNYLVSSSVNLLPDHPSLRIGSEMITHNRGMSEIHPNDVSLKQSYVLMYDDGQVGATVAQLSRLSSMNASTDDSAVPALRQNCFYLAQMYYSKEPGDAHVSGISSSVELTKETTAADLEEHFEQMNSLCARTVFSTTGANSNCHIDIESFADLDIVRDIADRQMFLLPDCLPGTQQSLEPSESEADMNSGAGSPTRTKGSRSWDPNTLFSICRWRSCLADADHCNNSRHMESVHCLCPYHIQLRDYLDNNSHPAGPSRAMIEASKFLPKSKAPNLQQVAHSFQEGRLGNTKAGMRDLVTLRAASTLLQEMWDGRLKTTLQAYVKKVIKEHNLRNKLCSSHFPRDVHVTDVITRKRSDQPKHHSNGETTGLPIPPRPSWITWKATAELDTIMHKLSTAETGLAAILEAERQTSHEIGLLAELAVYPSSELAVIRKEYKHLKESEDADQMQAPATREDNPKKAGSGNHESLIVELHLSEKKLAILRQRRQEEEDARTALLRKQAKLRAMEESQAKDPQSFRNQRSRS